MSLRILVNSEWTQMGTGYSNYYRELMEGLWDAGFHDLYEYASYCHRDDARKNLSKWITIPGAPARSDKEGMEYFGKNPFAHFGYMYFDETCAQVKPDLVIDIRDPWYFRHVCESPARQFFSLMLTPTVDSRPQLPEWLWLISQGDIVNTYSYFGKKTLTEEGKGFGISPKAVCPAGADKEFFDMYRKFEGSNKETFREKYNFPKKGIIFSFTSRNQIRKLIPETMYAFDEMIERGLVKDAYLHIHTSWPERQDGSWDLALAISRMKHPNRVFFTYQCMNCKKVFVHQFADSVINCPHCNGPSLMPNPGLPVPRDRQIELMYSADIGLQISIGEGQGMAIAEYKALGIPVITVPWSAMDEQAQKSEDITFENDERPYLGGMPVKATLFLEEKTLQYRAYPDFEDLTKKMEYWAKICSNPSEWAKIQKEAFEGALSIYDWPKTVNKYISQIKEVKSTRHLWLYKPVIQIDVNNVMNSIRQLNPEFRVEAFNSQIEKYLKICPETLQLWNTSIMIHSKCNIPAFSYGNPITNIEDIYKQMTDVLNRINKFNFDRSNFLKENA